ncbi:SDR family NAD(P)-dependent oxidoreductase [Beggiatoa leptomitoformis]|uniref:SDR family NAD(P)-dependent oxidoreductase n=1 Tax=Beggiatoa leptomitoformis TaxID=288004 RepID=A0A2N9YFQ6_9GAMM|nr:SDR family oxidoreductase [Beggiatoa leptomitoformis]ALG68375.1 SDR family NAD(P)-dependent oxidoreductase [Beggiatoa leptomitoformis]AUI69303.1 SDR family NAD(P)-dependent oxidoreductase [Beggiatoa leptomitoformis]
MDLQLKDKIALVTGSTAGIGRAIAATIAAEGATVILNGRTQAAVEKAIAEIAPTVSGKLLGFAGDLSSAEVAQQLLQQYPKVDILVNNLGIFEAVPFEEISDADWQRFFDVNVLSGVRLSRLYLSGMKQQNWGRIVFISSESALQIPAEMVHYGMSKTAQIAVARGLAESLAGTQITVNSILPGPTKSRGVDDFIGKLAEQENMSFSEFEQVFFQKMRPTSLIKRFATPEEVASLVAYVVSPLASATTGAALRVEGGIVKSAF